MAALEKPITAASLDDEHGAKVLRAYRAPTPSRVTRLLWWSAGADEQLLVLCPRSEHFTYAGIGGFVAVTSAIAFLTSSYALMIVLRPRDGASPVLPEFMSMLFGAFWSMAIFNLDRYIVSSSGKGDGKETISISELLNALPRLGLAVIIGIVMSAPLELRIFEPEIDAEMLRITSTKEAESRASLERTVGADLTRIRQSIASLDSQRVSAVAHVRRAENEATAELDGTGGSRSRNTGPIYRRKVLVAEAASGELDLLDKQLAPEHARLEAERLRLENARTLATKQAKATAERMDGLIARLGVLHEIGGSTPIFVMLLLIMFEITPVLSKLMHRIGPYDLLHEQLALISTARMGIHEETVEGVRNGMIVRRSTDRFPLAESVRRRAVLDFEPPDTDANRAP